MSIKHIIISGRVQGVGFRQYVLREATKLGVKGWTRNLSDGTVEIMVDIDPSQEKLFIDGLRRGPPFAKVDHVTVDQVDPFTQNLNQFEIIADGRN